MWPECDCESSVFDRLRSTSGWSAMGEYCTGGGVECIREVTSLSVGCVIGYRSNLLEDSVNSPQLSLQSELKLYLD